MQSNAQTDLQEFARKARLIAFYLPQYHPIPENDEWWGPGFTEWTNTAKARPLFAGHIQPHLPGDLGFYDLRLAETRADQAKLARRYGVEAFCYYHYWFGGRRILERPFQEVLRSGEPDFPFCLCWANESWSGIWHGLPKKLLIEQKYLGQEEARAHFDTLLEAFRDPRYLRIHGKPLFVVYNPTGLPDPKVMTAWWRQWAQEAGLPGLYLVGSGDQASFDPKALGFDAAFNTYLPNVRRDVGWQHPRQKFLYLLQRARGRPSVFDYERLMASIFPDPFPADRIPVAIPNWDNTPRSGIRGRVLQGATPGLFRQHLTRAMQLVAKRPAEERIVFLKSWNEWAEGNYLEPDREYGRQWLEVVDDVSRAP